MSASAGTNLEVPMSSVHISPGPTALLDARDTVRHRIAVGDIPAGGLTIELAGGDYPLTEAFHLGPEDAGSTAAPVTWQAAPGAQPLLLGGVMLHDFSAVVDTDIRKRLAPEARDQVVQVDLRASGVTDFADPVAGGLELFFDGRPMTLARWPNEGFVRITGLVGGDPVDVRGTKGDLIGKFHYDGDRPSRWVDEADPWMHGYWFWDWSDQRQRVESIDPTARVIAVEPPYNNYGYRVGQWFYAYNLLCELNCPGEFYVDRQAGILYFWPPAPLDGVEVAVSVADTLVSLQGADHVRLKGLTFECSRGTALTISASSGVHVDRCSVRNVGGWATRVEGGAEVIVAACEIEATGSGGVYLSGGDRPSLTPAGHVVEDCHIHHYGRVNRMYQPAVQIVGVGQRVSHNHIHDAPHMAVQFAGNDHVIEFNDVHHVCLESNDAGAVYSGRDWTWRVTRATMIGGGRYYLFENNLYVDCTPCVHLDARAMNWASYHVATTMKDRLDEMPINDSVWAQSYPELLTIWADEPAAPKGNIIRRNVSQGGEFDGVRDDARAYVDLTGNLVADDVGLAGLPPHSFALRPDSPAWAMGFEEIPEDRIGPRR